jgi:hypothetical protein
MNKHLTDLMHKEMTRKEFLTTLGLGIATAFGFGSLLRLLTGKESLLPHTHAASGYGSGTYGGR